MAGNHIRDRRAEFVGVFAYEDVGAYRDRFLMLGIVVERDTGNAVKGGLLGDISGVGDDALGMSRQPAEFQIAQRRSDFEE